MRWDQRSDSHQIFKTTSICFTSSSFPLDNVEAVSTQLWRSTSPHVQCLPVSIGVKGEVLTVASKAIHDPPSPAISSLFSPPTTLPLLTVQQPSSLLPWGFSWSCCPSRYSSVLRPYLPPVCIHISPFSWSEPWNHPVQHSAAAINLAITFSPTVFILF